MEQVLKGIKVLDLSQFLSGPRCTQLLADFGAEVVKVEPPLGEGMRWLMAPVPGLDRSLSNWHRSKKGITLEIRNRKGQELLKKLVPHFDILVENLAPGTMDKCGLGYNELNKINKGIIFCSITGFGRTGPKADRVAFDVIAQATSGILYAMGIPDRVHPVFIGDLVSGAYTALAILLALRHRDKTGEGQFIDVSMQDVCYFQNYRAINKRSTEPIEEALAHAVGGTFDDFFSGDRKKAVPFWNIYKATDGHIAIVFLTDAQWKKICRIIGHPELADDPRYANIIARTKNREDYRQLITAWMSAHSVAEIEKILVENRIPCGAVATTEQVNKDPQLAAREMTTWVDDPVYGKVAIPGIPFKMSKTPGQIKGPAPRLGQHNQEVYGKYLELTPAELDALKKEGVI